MRMASQNVKIRPLTVVLAVVAVGFVVLSIVYFTTPAHSLPTFFPGHEAHATRHHVKHGIAMVALAAVVLIAAWFTTAPKHDELPLS